MWRCNLEGSNEIFCAELESVNPYRTYFAQRFLLWSIWLNFQYAQKPCHIFHLATFRCFFCHFCSDLQENRPFLTFFCTHATQHCQERDSLLQRRWFPKDLRPRKSLRKWKTFLPFRTQYHQSRTLKCRRSQRAKMFMWWIQRRRNSLLRTLLEAYHQNFRSNSQQKLHFEGCRSSHWNCWS